jgi:2-iminobutanoate/2-iminopropanoate deaminase
LVSTEKEDAMEFFRMDGNRAAKLPFSDAVRVGDVLYLSGQMGVAPGTIKIVSGGIEAETLQMMENIERVLRHCGRTFDDVFKCTVMLADMSQWAAFNKIYLSRFKPDRLPARSAFGASALALGGAVEMECWAHMGR